MAKSRIKPKLQYVFLCDDVRQEMGGKFSLMGLFESIYTDTFPALHYRFVVFDEWAGGKGEFVVKLRLLTPDRKTILSESEIKMVLHDEAQKHRNISMKYNTTFPVPGRYWIEVLLDDERVTLVPLVLEQITKTTVH
ncbi:MAG: hypothetical protein WC539_01300 [Nitrospirota bacterium]